jgi:hypothetical protein
MRGNLQPEYQQITNIASDTKIATENRDEKRPRIDRSFTSPIGDTVYVGAVSCDQNHNTATAKSDLLRVETIRKDGCASKYPRVDFGITPNNLHNPTESPAPHDPSTEARISSSPLAVTLKMSPPIEQSESCGEITSSTSPRQEDVQSFKKLKINTARAISHHSGTVSLKKYLASRGSNLNDSNHLSASLPDVTCSSEYSDTRCEEEEDGLMNAFHLETSWHDNACETSKPKHTTLLQSLLPPPHEGNVDKTNQHKGDSSVEGDVTQDALKSDCKGDDNMSPLSPSTIEYEIYESDDEKRGVISNIAHSVWGLFSPTRKGRNV